MSEATTTDAVETGCGAVLRQAREKIGMSLADAARQVKMRINTLEALENEQWAQIGAPVFIRGQLRSYGRLLKVDVEPFLFQFEPQQSAITPDPLAMSAPSVSVAPLDADGRARRVVGVVVAIAVIAALAWWFVQPAATQKPQRTASLDVVSAPHAAVPGEAVSAAPPAAAEPASQTAATAALSLAFSQDCWVQISAPDGKVIEQGVIPAGAHRSYASGEVGKLVLGNAGAIEVEQNGNQVDTTPFQRANVARFTVSSAGSLAATKD